MYDFLLAVDAWKSTLHKKNMLVLPPNKCACMDSAGIPTGMQMYVITNCSLYCRSSAILVEVKGKVGSQLRWTPPKCSDYDPFLVSPVT